MAKNPTILDTPQAQADYCKALRNGANLTQPELAEAMGYAHYQTIANAENANSKGRTGTRIKIIRHLKPKAEVTEAIVVQE